MSITVKSFSAEELLHMPDDGFRYELVDGELIKMSLPGGERGAITVNITVLPAQHVKAKGSALFLAQRRDPSLAGIRHGARTLRGIRPTPARAGCRGAERLLAGPPDLAAEVLSPEDTAKAAREKAEKWIAAGTVIVWTVNSGKRAVVVNRSGSSPAALTENSILNGGEVVPGFRCRVAELFASGQAPE
jgi:Uma2 family endonuclease